MEIFIFTKRFEEYEPLFSVFRGTDLLFTRTADPEVLAGRGHFPLPRIVLADPRLMEERTAVSGGITDMNDPDVRIIIGSPSSGSGLARELKREMEAQGIFVSRYVPAEMMEETAVRYRPMNAERQVRKLAPEEKRIRKERTIIGIAGMSPGAGCTFLTLLLAEELAAALPPGDSLLSVLSVEDPSIYNALGMKERFQDREFMDPADLLNREERTVPNLDEGISWAVAAPFSEAAYLLTGEKAAIARSLPGNIVLWDMGYKELGPLLRQGKDTLDALILVVDPLPSALLEGYANLDTVRGCACPSIFLLNKWNTGVELETFVLCMIMRNLVSAKDFGFIYCLNT